MTPEVDLSVGPSPKRVPFALWLSLLSVALYIGWLVSGYNQVKLNLILGVGFLIFGYYLGSWFFFQSSRRPDLPKPTRRALALVATYMAVNATSGIYLVADYYFVREMRSISFLSTALFLAVYPLMMGVLWLLPRAKNPSYGILRIFLDGAAFVIGLGIPLWVFSVHPELMSARSNVAIEVVVPAFAFVAIVAINAALLTSAPVPSRAALWMLLAGMGISTIVDIVYALDTPSGLVNLTKINWANLTNALSLGFMYVAAWRFRADPMPARREQRAAAFSPIPMIVLLVVGAWMILMLAKGRFQPAVAEGVLIGVVALLLFLLVREFLVLRDSLRLFESQAVTDSRARFEALVRRSSDVIMVIDPSRRILFASPATAAVLGIAPEAAIGADPLAWVHPEDAARGKEFLDTLARIPRGYSRVAWRLRHADGSFRHLETSGGNLLQEPTVGGLVLNSRDVTERAMLEERLHQSIKMDAIGRLAGGMAHDFNNLLAIILSNSELALMDLPEDHPVRPLVDAIRDASMRGASMTSRLRAFTRRDQVNPQLFDPSKFLDGVLQSMRHVVGSAIAVTSSADPGMGLVRLDPFALEQALINMASNARDALPSGGSLAINLHSRAIESPLASPYLPAPPGRYVVVEVTDNGCGMDEATLKRLFEPFFSTKEQARGTGLGLSSVFEMVKASSGGLVVRSALGRGTTFEIWLPEVQPEAEAAAPTLEPAGRPVTVLLVEDEVAVRDATERILAANGYRVLPAANAAEGRAVFQRAGGSVKLLVTDVIMPGETGPKLAADLLALNPDLKVLYFSGFAGDELDALGVGKGNAPFLVKPFTSSELIDRVRQALAGPPARPPAPG